jgi:hypothetical protein
MDQPEFFPGSLFVSPRGIVATEFPESGKIPYRGRNYRARRTSNSRCLPAESADQTRRDALFPDHCEIIAIAVSISIA